MSGRTEEAINTFLNHWSIDGKKTKPRTFQVARHHEYQQHSHRKYGRHGRNVNIHKIEGERATRPLEKKKKKENQRREKKKQNHECEGGQRETSNNLQ